MSRTRKGPAELPGVCQSPAPTRSIAREVARAARPAGPLPRRVFLRGLGGVALGLPFLESLAPRNAQAQEAPLLRFGVFFGCNGVNMDHWFPNAGYGPLTDAHLLGTANEALLPFRNKLLFPRGVHMAPRSGGRDPGGGDDHGRCMAHKLTAFAAGIKDGLAQGPSIDQILARQINPGSEGARRPALNLMVGNQTADAGLGYISYSGPGQAVQALNNPWNAYSELIGLAAQSGGSEEARERLTAKRQSVMDLVRGQFDRLRGASLSSDDRQKLDAHFTAIREVEVRLASTGVACTDSGIEQLAEQYRGNPELAESEENYPAIADLQVDIYALALACDVTRVATLHFDRGSGGPTFRWDGMSHEYNHHKLSHGKVSDECFGDSTDNGCSNVEGFEDKLFEIDRWHQRKLARLLERLDSYVEAGGRTVLDNSLILYTNEMSDGKLHSFMDLPYIFAGGLGGRFRRGLYYPLGPEGQTDRSAPHNRLLNTIVNAMGVESEWFGQPEGSGGATMEGGIYDELLA